MTAASDSPSPSVEWRRAGRALGRLIADSSRTEEVFELIDALAGASGERCFQRFAASPAGRQLLAERPSLLEALSDRDALRALPEDSFGRAYARFMDEAALSAEGLVEASEAPARSVLADPDPDRDFFFARLRDSHDLWHVLTGYGRDEAGEVALLAFTFAQTGNRGIGAIVAVATVIGLVKGGWSWPGYLRRAYRRGRRAERLQQAPYEKLLARPLAEVRSELDIEAPEVAHPGGIVAVSREDIDSLVGGAAA